VGIPQSKSTYAMTFLIPPSFVEENLLVISGTSVQTECRS
jgi:hypothetical protein